MIDYTEVEVFYIEEPNKDNEMFAWISFKDPNWKGGDPTNGYNNIKVPVKLRPIQLSVRGNVLVDQSEKDYTEATNNLK